MSSFTTPLIVQLLDDGRTWRLEEEFRYRVGDETGEPVAVPKGFETDFASIPRIFWAVLSPYGRHGKSAVIHDWCYKKHLFTRLVCDRIFLEAMKVLGVRRWKYRVMYRAVRMFGWIAWRKHGEST